MQDEMEEEDSMSEIFRFDSVSVWPNPEAQDEGESVYEAETENMDGVITLFCFLFIYLYILKYLHLPFVCLLTDFNQEKFCKQFNMLTFQPGLQILLLIYLWSCRLVCF